MPIHAITTLFISCLVASGLTCIPSRGETQVSGVVQTVPECRACGASISGVYYKIPGLPEFYCEKCYQSLPRCFFCGRPVRSAPTDDGRVVCQECQHEVIRDHQQEQRLVEQVKDWIQGHLQLQLPAIVHFEFVKDLAPYVDVQLTGSTRELGAFLRNGEEVRILLLDVMPRATLIETVAHELAHVWQNGRIPKNQPLEVKEGFAQWIASKVLKAFKCSQTLRVLREREDLYGQGYRLIQAVEEKNGPAAVITYVRKSH